MPSYLLKARQGVDLTGFGNATFDRAVQSIEEIRKNMGGYLSMKQGEESISHTYRNWKRISASTRYFTARSAVPHEVLNDIPESIDPMKILQERARTAKPAVVHIAENKVSYREMVSEEDEDGVM